MKTSPTSLESALEWLRTAKDKKATRTIKATECAALHDTYNALLTAGDKLRTIAINCIPKEGPEDVNAAIDAWDAASPNEEAK